MSDRNQGPKPLDPATDGAHMQFDGKMSYGDYLALDQILTAQHPKSTAHDEILFIIQHQTTELWLKLVLHELGGAVKQIRGGELRVAFKMLARVSRIFDQLIQAWEVLATMTPSEYSEFRPALGQSSGFQSWQYRAIEFVAGNKNPAMMPLHEHRPDLHKLLNDYLAAPSLYDESIRVLARRGFAIDKSVIERDFTQPYVPNASVQQAWIDVYRSPKQHWDLYELAEELVDFEAYFRQWRFRHVTTVERIIGMKRGTGGTSGVTYLRKMVEVRLFPELWDLRTEI